MYRLAPVREDFLCSKLKSTAPTWKQKYDVNLKKITKIYSHPILFRKLSNRFNGLIRLMSRPKRTF